MICYCGRRDRGNACAFHPLYGGGYALFLLHGGGCGASAAGRQGNFIHMPMESLTLSVNGSAKGFFGIWTMPPFGNAWRKPFSVLPDAAGMNNHMGSAIMEDARSLSAVMEVLKEKDVPF